LILLDSDVLIEVLKMREPAFSFVNDLRSRGEEIGTLSICAAEVLRGARRYPAQAGAVADALAGLPQVPFGPAAARRFGVIMDALDRAGRPVGATDGFIAAATLEAGARIVTLNVKEFRRVPGLEVLEPT
jgi:tRNA(fMet)-specific endonuclease VapC